MDEIRPVNGVARKENHFLTEVKNIAVVIFATLFYAITTYVFVLDSKFAPSGLSGVLAMIETVKDLDTGTYVLLLFNAPLLIWAFFSLSKRFAVYTTLSVTVMCTTFFLFDYLDPEGKFRFATTINIGGEIHPDFGKRLFCSIVSGFCAGISIALTFRHNASLGGVDIIVSLIQKKWPRANVSFLLFGVNAVIIVASYFVFDKNIESVCFAIIYIIIFSKVCEYILNGINKALKFEVVTEHAEELAKELIEKLGHSVTVTPARGMYANKEKNLLICVIRSRQVAEFEKILKKYPDTFAFTSSVSEVFGVFFK